MVRVLSPMHCLDTCFKNWTDRLVQLVESKIGSRTGSVKIEKTGKKPVKIEKNKK